MVNIDLLERLRKLYRYSMEDVGVYLGANSYRYYQYRLTKVESFSIKDISMLSKLYGLTPNDLMIESNNLNPILIKSILKLKGYDYVLNNCLDKKGRVKE